MIYLNGWPVDFRSFPNNEMYADVDASAYGRTSRVNKITFKFEDDKDIFHLIAVKDFVDEAYPNVPTELVMAYIPYSRMDRKENNRLFTLKSFSKIINNMGFSRVIVDEPHSEVSTALINNIHVNNVSSKLVIRAMCDIFNLQGSCWYTNYYKGVDANGKPDHCLDALFDKAKEAGVYLVYPDAGAEKRYSKQITYPNVMTCKKKRDFNTGKIEKITVDEVQDCKIAIIVDDLSSRGGTFIGSARALRESIEGLEKVILCVTHCENTIYMGDVFRDNSPIDTVYTTKSILIDPNTLCNVLSVNGEELMKNLPPQDKDETFEVFKDRVERIVRDRKLIIDDKMNFDE